MHMNKKFLSVIAAALSIAAAPLSSAVRADFPAKIFAPYMYIGSGDDFKLTACDDACGVKYYTLAFIIARQESHPAPAATQPATAPAATMSATTKPRRRKNITTYFPEAAWDGSSPMQQNKYADQIDAIRKRGGDVIISFGGAGGHEVALEAKDPAQLEAIYQSVIDQYHFTWLDFDVEGGALDKHPEASVNRNIAILALQQKNPGLIVSFTLPVDPNGVSEQSQKLLADAVARGVKVHSVDLMTMDFGKDFSEGKKMADVCIASVEKAHEQTAKIDPSIQIGICAMIGQNDEKGEIFTLDDARQLTDYAKKTPWVCSTAYWAINRDNGEAQGKANSNLYSGVKQEAFDFARIFNAFTESAPAK
jgi:hypothetical protein